MRKRIGVALFFVAANAFAVGRELAPRPLIPWRGFTHGLSVASAGGKFLTVWRHTVGDDSAIVGALSDASGVRISPSPFPIPEGPGAPMHEVALVGTGDSFALFWTDSEDVVHLMRLDGNGRVIDTHATSVRTRERLRAAWDGERFLVTGFLPAPYSSMRMTAALLRGDGTVILDEIPLDADSSTRATEIAVVSDGFVVFTGSAYHFFAHAIARDGSVTRVDAGDPTFDIASAAREDGTLLVVSATLRGRLHASLWKEGTRLQEQTIAVDTGFVPLHLMRAGGGFLLVLRGPASSPDELFALLLSDDGVAVGEPAFAAVIGALSPRTASNGSVVLIPHQRTPTDVVSSVTVRSDATAGPVEALTFAPANQQKTIVGSGGGSMLAIFAEETATPGTRIRAAAIGRDLQTESVRELEPHAFLISRTLPWNGTEYLVLHVRGGQLVALRVAHDGSVIGNATLLGSFTWSEVAAATWAGDRWAVAWIDWETHRARYATVSRSGIASAPRDLHLSDDAIVVDLALTFDGRHVHLAWSQSPYPPFPTVPHGQTAFTTRLRRDGAVIDAAPLALPTTHPNRITLASNGEHVVLLLDDRDGTSIHILAARTREILSSRSLFDWPAASDLTWDGSEFVAALGYRGARRYVTVHRLGRDGDGDEPPRITTVAGDSSVSIAASAPYGAIVGRTDRDATSGARAAIHSEREMSRAPDPPPPPTNVRVRTLHRDLLELTWETEGEVESIAVEGRRRDGRIEGVLMHGPGVARVWDCDAMRVRTFAAGVPSPWSEWITAQPLPRRRAARP